MLATFDVSGDGSAMQATKDHPWIQVDDPVDSTVQVDQRIGEAVPIRQLSGYDLTAQLIATPLC